MTNSPKQLIAAAVLAAVSLIAAAQMPQTGAPGAAGQHQRMQGQDPAQMQQRMQEHRQQRFARRMAHMKDVLQLAPAQEAAFNAWTTAMQPPAGMNRPNRAEIARLPTPERIDRMRALRTERMARMDRRGEATKVFYAGLNPVQKRVFDLETARRGQRGEGRWQRGGNYRGHHGHHGR